MAERKTRNWATGALAVIAIAMGLLVVVGDRPAAAQSGWWPWATEPIPGRRPPPVRRQTAPNWREEPPSQPGGYAQPGQRSAVCLQLEQSLVEDQQRGSQTREALPRIETELRQLQRSIRSGESQLERSDCYDYFLFAKTLRRSRRCVALSNEVETTRRQAAALDSQRRQILGSGARSIQDDLIRELARNNCGPRYNQEADRRGVNNPFAPLWQDQDGGPTGRGNQFNTLPFATYRTVCVRLCDGYYFPISFSTLENHFSRDVDVCQSKCAAPVELYYHQNPGGSMEQAKSVSEHRPYTSLKTAFRYRKEYIRGCSCKQTEYTPQPGDQGERKTEAVPSTRPVTRQAKRP